MNHEAKVSKGTSIGLWVAQALLALAFGAAGMMKLTISAADLAQQSPDFSIALVRFIGIMEVLGALGVILPAAARIAPKLTPLAAIGLGIIMVLAFSLHVSRGEWTHVPPTAVLGLLAAFVAWGRLRKAPLAPR